LQRGVLNQAVVVEIITTGTVQRVPANNIPLPQPAVLRPRVVVITIIGIRQRVCVNLRLQPATNPLQAALPIIIGIITYVLVNIM